MLEADGAHDFEPGVDRGEADGAEAEATSTGRAFERWIDDHHGDVYRYAVRLSGSTSDADDLTQQTFLQAWRFRDRLESADRARGWLLAITRNQFLKELRRRRPESFTTIGLEAVELVETRSGDRTDDLAELLEGLGDEARTMLLMFYVERLSYREIAAELGIPVGTVMSRLHRAKGRLRTDSERRQERDERKGRG